MLEIERADRYRAPFVLEGGSIHVDGEGTVLSTEECLLNGTATRGSGASGSRPGCATISGRTHDLARRGVFNDETDGHIDNLACFVRPGVVALTWTDDWPTPSARSPATPSAAGGGHRCPRPAARGDPGPGARAHLITAEEARGVSRGEGYAAAAPVTGWRPPT